MFTKTAATAAAITFALALPADALGLGGGGLGGGLGGRGKGGKSTSGSSTSSSGKSSSGKSGGVSAGASVGRGGVSAGASVGGISAGASIGRSGASTNASVGSAAGVGASVSRSGVSTSTSVGGLSVDTSVSRTGVSATVGGLATSGAGAQQQQQALTVPATSVAALLLLPLPAALQPGSSQNRSCIQDGKCSAASARIEEGRASTSDPVQTGSAGGNIASALAQKPGTPASIVSACQLAAARAAQAYGALSVEAASGGKFTATDKGGGVAPVNLRVTYPGTSGSRQARVSCAINSDGVVTGLNI